MDYPSSFRYSMDFIIVVVNYAISLVKKFSGAMKHPERLILEEKSLKLGGVPSDVWDFS